MPERRSKQVLVVFVRLMLGKPVAVVGVVLALLLREVPLREHSSADSPGDDLAIVLEGAALE